MDRIAVTGENGRLGRWLVGLGCIPLGLRLTPDSEKFGHISSSLVHVRPDAIINCAAWTKVDQAELDQDGAWEGNVTSVRALVSAANQLSNPPLLVHISTDYVFSGQNGPYREIDELDSRGGRLISRIPTEYGRTKAHGEIEVGRYKGQALIIRTTFLYDHRTPNFATAMLSQFQGGRSFPLYFADIRGNPTYIPHLAEKLIRLVETRKATQFTESPVAIHMAGPEVVTRANFAWALADVFGLDRNLLQPTSIPPPGFEGAPRAVYGGLNTAFSAVMGLQLPGMMDGLKSFRDRLTSQKRGE